MATASLFKKWRGRMKNETEKSPIYVPILAIKSDLQLYILYRLKKYRKNAIFKVFIFIIYVLESKELNATLGILCS